MGFVHQRDPHKAEQSVNDFMFFYRQAPPADQAALQQVWEEAGLGAFPESEDQAVPAKLPTPQEALELERQRAETERQRAEAERQRTEAERQRAEAEARRAATAEAEVTRLRALLAEVGRVPK